MKFNVNVDPRLNLSQKAIAESADLPACVSFSGAFNEESAKKFREEFIGAENAAKATGQEVLPLIIDSYGGAVYSLLSMVDVIKNCDLKVATIVESKAMSCGAVLFSCGTEGYRFISPRATVMIHWASHMTSGKLEDMKADVNEANRVNGIVFDLMDENCNKPKHFFKNKVDEHKFVDWFLSPEDCIECNLANHIGVPQMDINISLEHKFRIK